MKTSRLHIAFSDPLATEIREASQSAGIKPNQFMRFLFEQKTVPLPADSTSATSDVARLTSEVEALKARVEELITALAPKPRASRYRTAEQQKRDERMAELARNLTKGETS